MVGPGHYRSNIRYFSAGDPSNTKFVSLASRVSYSQPPGWPGDTRCYIAFQESIPDSWFPPAVADYGHIYYVEAWQDSTSSNVIDTGRLTTLSAGEGCDHRTPCIALDQFGLVVVAWETAFPQIETGGLKQYVTMRWKTNAFPPVWADYVSWYSNWARPSSPGTLLLPQNSYSFIKNLAFTPWRDWTRIAWNDSGARNVTIVHFGYTSSYLQWYRNHFVEASANLLSPCGPRTQVLCPTPLPIGPRQSIWIPHTTQELRAMIFR